MDTSNEETQRTVDKLAISLFPFSSGRVTELISQVTFHSIGVSSYEQKFSEEAKIEAQNGNEVIADTFQILAIVSHFAFNSGETAEPFEPLFRKGTMRSAIPDDMTDEQMTKLDEASQLISDPELVARLSDVVWVKSKNYKSAQRAIDAYLDAAVDTRRMERVRFERLERAFRLAKQINSKDYWLKCKKIFDDFRENRQLYTTICLDLLTLAQTLSLIEGDELANESKQLALTFQSSDPFLTESLLLIAATIHKKLGNNAEAASCNKIASDAFVSAANQRDALSATSFLEKAIEALQRGGGYKDQILALNKLLTQKGQESLSQMKKIESGPIDFTDTVKSSKKFVEGLSPLDALQKLSYQFPVLSFETHEKEVQESFQNHPLMYLISSKSISSQGRQYSRRDSFVSDNPEEQKEAMESEICSSMERTHKLVSQFCLLPALDEVRWTTKDFVSLFNVISHRPFIPPHRAQIFFLGIKHGLDGDFVSAAHILIPQLENALRFQLEVRGHPVVTSVNGIQSEMPLNLIFKNYRNQLEQIFGSKDLVFTMETFLCKRTGQNFRNDVSHGLVDGVLDYRYVFTWWMAIHLVYLLKFAETAE